MALCCAGVAGDDQSPASPVWLFNVYTKTRSFVKLLFRLIGLVATYSTFASVKRLVALPALTLSVPRAIALDEVGIADPPLPPTAAWALPL